MTEKERHQAFNDPDNWAPSVEYPSTGFIRVLAFEFYSVTFYKLQIYTNVYHWNSEKRNGETLPEWATKFHFIRRDGHLETLSMSDIWKLMKEAEE